MIRRALVLAILCTIQLAIAQKINITGRVQTADGTGVSGATVFLKNHTTISTSTKVDGSFVLSGELLSTGKNNHQNFSVERRGLTENKKRIYDIFGRNQPFESKDKISTGVYIVVQKVSNNKSLINKTIFGMTPDSRMNSASERFVSLNKYLSKSSSVSPFIDSIRISAGGFSEAIVGIAEYTQSDVIVKLTTTTHNKYYMSTSGADKATISSQASPWRTFSYAFSHMKGGDTLVLLKGTYSESAGNGYISYLGTNSAQIPSGINRREMTVVTSEKPGSVTVNGGLFIGRSTRKDSCIAVIGIRFEGESALYNSKNIYLKTCGFHAQNEALTVGTNDHDYGNTYNLIEDCWAWASQARIITSNYRADYNVFRRFVLRGDGCNTDECSGSGNPNVGFTVYESKYCSIQNVVILDRILGGGEPYADFATAQHSGSKYALGHNQWLGCISYNAPDGGFNFEAETSTDSTIQMENCVTWKSKDFGFNISSPTFRNIRINNLTAGYNVGSNFRFMDVPSGKISNIISTHAGLYGYIGGIVPSYVCMFQSGEQDYHSVECQQGCLTIDPESGTSAALRYILRIEDGSQLAASTAVVKGYGANIQKRYGMDGTFYGENGFNSLTTTNLWPYPNEDIIKEQMSQNATRGFCASGESLTHYLWNALGNGSPY
jgi:hypothetical protein